MLHKFLSQSRSRPHNISINLSVISFMYSRFFSALYGVIFSKESEAAFSNYRMWESLGFIIAFAYSAYICTSTKLYVTISVLFLGMIGYLIVEFMTYKKSKAEEALGKQGMETANGTVNVGYEKTETPWSVAEPKSFDENRLSTKL